MPAQRTRDLRVGTKRVLEDPAVARAAGEYAAVRAEGDAADILAATREFGLLAGSTDMPKARALRDDSFGVRYARRERLAIGTERDRRHPFHARDANRCRRRRGIIHVPERHRPILSTPS